MTQSFEPREAGTSAWKTWQRDGWRLLGRVGGVGLGLWCVALAALAMGLARWTSGSGAYLIAVAGTLVLGVLTQPVLQRALDQAAQGRSVAWGEAFALAAGDVLSNPGWFVRRALAQVGFYTLLLLIMAGLLLAARSMATAQGSAPTAPDPLNPVVSLMVTLICVPAICRLHGVLDFNYWLRVRQGLDRSLSGRLHLLAGLRNSTNLWFSMIVLFAAYLGAVLFNPLALLALPLLHWYHAAVARCAYHDIFDGGTGLKAKAKAPVAAAAPAGGLGSVHARWACSHG